MPPKKKEEVLNFDNLLTFHDYEVSVISEDQKVYTEKGVRALTPWQALEKLWAKIDRPESYTQIAIRRT